MAEQSSREDIVLGVALTDAREGEAVRVRKLATDEVGLRMNATPRQVCERVVRFVESETGETQAWRELMLISVEAKAALDSGTDDPYDGVAHAALANQTEDAIEGLKLVLRIARDKTMATTARTIEVERAAKRVLDQLEDEDH